MSRAGVSAAVAVAACGSVTLAAGCGGSSSAAAPCRPGPSRSGTVAAGRPRRLSVVGRAAVKTQHAGTARFAMHVQAANSAAQSITFTGVMDLQSPKGVLYFSAPTARTSSGEIRIVGHCEYLSSDLGLTSSKPWASVDIDRLLPAFSATSPSSPTDSLHMLESTGTFHRVGAEHVRGVATTHYHGVLDVGKASAPLPKLLKKELRKTGVSTMPTNAWIDGSGFLRKMTTTLSGVTVSIEYYDFGVTVNVSAPPADQVQDVTDKFKSVLGG